MTWHLKDRELEEALEKYSDGNFVKALNFAIERDWIDAENVVTVEFERKFLSRDYTNDLSFRTDELEDILDYNPKDWNNYPEVTPPYDVMMLIDLAKKSYGLVGFYKHSKEGDCWCFADGSTVPTCLSEQIIRFRPWKD